METTIFCPVRSYPSQNPFRQFKSSPKHKTADLKTMSYKAVACVIIFTLSISLALFSALYNGSGGGGTRPDFSVLHKPPNPTRQYNPTNVSHLAFGIAGSTRTWTNRVHYSDLWWNPGVNRGFVFLEKEITGESKIPVRVSSDWRKFTVKRKSDSAVRLARVVVDLFRIRLPEVRWFVMGDDDTVFFPENLAAVLDKYDHREMVYVGGNSESVEQNERHMYDMAFGGGGFAISYPLAAALDGAMDGCLKRYWKIATSDEKVSACVAEYGVRLSRESGFHQMDIRGHPFGLLTTHPLAPLVSLHHLDAMNPLFPNQTQLESLKHLIKAYKTDPSRILQQSFCYERNYNWSISIAWGYSVQLYPILMTAVDLETPPRTFKTWRSRKYSPFTFNTRKMSSDPCELPLVFFLDTVKGETSNGTTVTSYKQLKDGLTKTCDGNHDRALAIKDIIVSAPKMDPNEWKQGLRRQCCDIIGITGQEKMEIRIRKCEQAESLTI